MIISTYLIIAVLVLYALLIRLSNRRYRTQVNRLFSLRHKSAPRIFNHSQISKLSSPVEKYFRLALKEGQSYPGTIRLKYGGQFRTALNTPWIPIHGEQYFTTLPAGFIWKGNTALVSVRDMCIGAKEKLEVFLLDALTIVNGNGEKFDQGELLRWLAESAWFPIHSKNAIPRVNMDELIPNYLVSFNKSGEITRFPTRRYRSVVLEPWVNSLSAYSEIRSVINPLLAEASWKIDGKKLPYARFEIQQIEYDWGFVFNKCRSDQPC